MAMFHGYDYLEREKIDVSGEDFPAHWESIEVSHTSRVYLTPPPPTQPLPLKIFVFPATIVPG